MESALPSHATVWTPEQQLMELTRRLSPVETVENTPLSFSTRPSDIFVVTSPKSGTTWVTHICHQLRTKGEEPDFEEQVPEVITILEWSQTMYNIDPNTAVQPAEPRIYHSHLPYDKIPKGGKYIYCFRDQKDALYSYYLHNDTMAFLKGRVSLPIFIDYAVNKIQWTAKNLRSLVVWWEHRHDGNVLLMFFDDLKEDHAGCVRRIAKFMGLDCDEETIARVVFTTTHAEMAKHLSKFDFHSFIQTISKVAGEEPPTMLTSRVRRDGGRSGDGEKLPHEVQQQIEEEWRLIVTSKTGYRDLKEMREAWKKEVRVF